MSDTRFRTLHAYSPRRRGPAELMKVAPVLSALKHYSGIKQTLIHTGQHYDVNMSDVFFQQLEIPAPTSIWGWDREATPVRPRIS